MKIIQLIIVLCFSFLLSSCSAIGAIFKTGMGAGIFITVAVVVVIVYFAMKAGKNKS